jgi:hypothetical protein
MSYFSLKLKISIVLFFVFSIAAIAQDITLSKVADKVASEICKKKCLDLIGKKQKIAICLFLEKDTIKTPLGIELSEKIVHPLNLMLNKTDYEILFPDNIEGKFLQSSMYKYFTPPNSDAEESEYWKKYLDNKKPDYWLTGNYIISDDGKSIIIKNVYFKYNSYEIGENKKQSIAVDADFTIPISPEEQTSIAELNQPISNSSDTYFKLINIEGEGNLFSMEVVDKNQKIIDEKDPLIIGKDYQLKITLKEKAFIYAFYYDAKDKDHNFFDVIYPFDKTKICAVDTGIYYLPNNALITIDPPVGQAYIQIIATKKLVPIDFDQFTGSDGYSYSYFKEANCKRFLEQLAKLSPKDFDKKYLIKNITKFN